MATTPRPTPLAWSTSHQAPLWVAIALYAYAIADEHGEARLTAGQLRDAVAPGASASQISQAIRRACIAGWLDERSCVWELVVRRGA